MLNDTLANALSTIQSYELDGKMDCEIKPYSKLIKEVLDLLNKRGYVGTYEIVDDGKGGILRLNLIGQINKCGVIKPRFSVQKDNYEKYEKRFLPSKDFGILIISTNQGIMTHYEAKEKGLGGKLVAFCY